MFVILLALFILSFLFVDWDKNPEPNLHDIKQDMKKSFYYNPEDTDYR